MDINGTALRMLTLACYFLPFVFWFTTCVDGVGRTAYNRADAIQNEKDKIIAEKKDLLEAAANLVADKITVGDTSVETTSETIKLLEAEGDAWLLNPSVTSVSALGFIFMYEDALPRILLALSIIISLLSFVLWRWLKRKNLEVYLISGNLFLVVVFWIFCFVSSITVLLGAYVLGFLLLVQLLSALQEKRKRSSSPLEEISAN